MQLLWRGRVSIIMLQSLGFSHPTVLLQLNHIIHHRIVFLSRVWVLLAHHYPTTEYNNSIPMGQLTYRERAYVPPF